MSQEEEKIIRRMDGITELQQSAFISDHMYFDDDRPAEELETAIRNKMLRGFSGHIEKNIEKLPVEVATDRDGLCAGRNLKIKLILISRDRLDELLSRERELLKRIMSESPSYDSDPRRQAYD